MKLPTRQEVPVELTWDLSLIYKTEEEFETDLKKAEEVCTYIESFKGRMKTAQDINQCLDAYQELRRLSYLTGAYTSLAAAVDYTDAELQQKSDRTDMKLARLSSRTSFVEGQISRMDQEVLQEAADQSKTNRGYIREILRRKPHQLSEETENALAALQTTFGAPYTIYECAKLADMKFDSFTVGEKEYPLGYSLFEDDYEYHPDPEVRRTAFRAFSDKIRQYANVTAAAYNAQVQQEKTIATLRGFDSVIDYLLFEQNVTREMYDRQIDLIMTELAPHMRKYASILKKERGLDKMTYADLKMTLDPEYSPKLTIDESREYVKEGLSVMGPEYQEMIDRAYRERWFDFANNQGKATGGFCETPYGKNSYILLSFNGNMSDIFTIAHELGHAGHFDACNQAQSILDTDVSCYFVEAPSTMNEILLSHYMLTKSDDKRFRRYIHSNLISNTYYHNFVTHLLEAAYQREVYKLVDQGESVQADTLNQIYYDVLKKFWGDEVELTEGAELTWMRQPHYYMGLYSYTYSAGLTIATQVALRIQKEGQPAVDDWKKVLAAGGTYTSLELARMAGVDITTDQPLKDTIAYIGSIINQI